MKSFVLATLFPPSLALALIAAPSSAHASMAYAYAYDSMRSLSFDGSVHMGDDTTTSHNTAQFSGYGKADKSDPIDAQQAFVGPGARPGENDFSKKLGTIGQFSRSDSQIVMNDHQTFNVAEGYRTSPGSGLATGETDWQFTLKQTDVNGILFKFSLAPSMQVETKVTDMGAGAIAQLVASLTLTDNTGKVVMSWKPNGNTATSAEGALTVNAGSVSNIKDPFNVNKDLFCAGDCGPIFYQPPATTQDYQIQYDGGVNSVFNVDLHLIEHTEVYIDEPGGVAAIGLGMGLLLIRRRGMRTAA